jgi:hypothetical protein
MTIEETSHKKERKKKENKEIARKLAQTFLNGPNLTQVTEP